MPASATVRHTAKQYDGLRGSKGHLYEDGIRVLLIARWPGVVRSKTVCSTPVISTDFYPTLLDVAGLKPKADKKIDGESLMPKRLP